MKFRTIFINIILLGLLLTGGCETTETKQNETKTETEKAKENAKVITSIRLHMEVSADGITSSRTVSVYRASPVYLTVENTAFADERDVARAAVIDWMGGFAIQLNFDRHGQWMLENVTRRYPNRHVAVECTIGKELRCIAAPLISRPISDGVLTFTPDATREESELIVQGLNNAAKQIKKSSQFFQP